MTCRVVENAIVCDGQSGGWRVGTASCPFCCLQDREVRVLFVWIFGGYGGRDHICGECGQKWASEDERLHKMTDEKREENKARVAATPDPTCWDCHDTGDLYPTAAPDTFCKCAAGIAAAAELAE
jgi:hypothetical protein